MSFVAPLASYAAPGFGPTARAAPVTVTLAADGTACQVNLLGMAPGQAIPAIATLFIDASGCPVPTSFLFSDTGMSVDVPAFTQGYYPVFTNSFQFSVSSPEVAALGQAVTVPIQVISVPVQTGQPVTRYPNGNAGVVQSIGNPLGWTSFAFTVPGSALIYASLEIDNSGYSQPVQIAGTDIAGDPWSVTVAGFTSQEFSIPPTAAGSAATATTSTPSTSGETDALIPLRWRVALAGVAPSSSLPAALTGYSVQFAAPAAGITTHDLALPPGFGGYVGSVQVNAALGVGASFSVALIDNSGTADPATPFWQGVFAANSANDGSIIFSAPVGWCSEFRGGNIGLQADFVAAATGNLFVQVQWSPVAASQNG